MPFLVEQLDAVFLAHLEKLQEVADANAAATCLGGQRQWSMPPLNGWSGDTMDISGMNAAFDRTELNHTYQEVISDEQQRGRQGEAGVLKLQLDYIAARERSFRTRHASSIRCKIHAAARRGGHAAAGGLFDTASGSIAIWLQRLLAAAHADPEA